MPKASDIRRDKILTNIAIGYAPQNFVAEEVAPVISVTEQGGIYFEYDREELRSEDDRRAPGAESNEVQWDVSQTNYWCEDYALKQMLPDKILKQNDLPVGPQITTVKKITEKIKLNREKDLQAIAQGAGVETYDITGSSHVWSGADADPDADAQYAIGAIRDRTGLVPNKVLISWSIRDVLVRYLKAQARLTYGEAATINDLPLKMWGCDVIVPTPVENTANPEQDDVIADVWSDEVLFFYSENAPSVMSLSFMYTLRYMPWGVNRWRIPSRKGEFFEVELGQIQKMVCADCGERLINVI